MPKKKNAPVVKPQQLRDFGFSRCGKEDILKQIEIEQFIIDVCNATLIGVNPMDNLEHFNRTKNVMEISAVRRMALESCLMAGSTQKVEMKSVESNEDSADKS